MNTEIATTYVGDVCNLTMHPPAGKPPTLDYTMIAAMERALQEISQRAGALVAVVLQSSSPKFFCAGANLNVMATMDETSVEPWIQRGHQLMNQLAGLPLPVIARVEGYAMGGGLELAMACDLIMASEQARFAQSEARLGLVTGWGGCRRLARRVGLPRARELCFTGRLVDSSEAAAIGLADWQGNAGELTAELASILNAMRQNSRVAVREMKRILEASVYSGPDEAAAIETAASQRCLVEGDALARVQQFLHAKGKASRPEVPGRPATTSDA